MIINSVCQSEAGSTVRPLSLDDSRLASSARIFSTISPTLLNNVLSKASILRCDYGETILRQGEEPSFLHVLLDGQVGLTAAVSNGDETMIEIVRPKGVFIASAVMTGRPYPMTAVSLEPSRILLLPVDSFRRDLREMPELATGMLDSLSTDCWRLVTEVKELKLKSASQRLARYLLTLTPRKDGGTSLWLPHNKRVMAARVGTRPETLSRTFAALRSFGVEIKGSLVTIRDIAILAAYCMEGEAAV